MALDFPASAPQDLLQRERDPLESTKQSTLAFPALLDEVVAAEANISGRCLNREQQFLLRYCLLAGQILIPILDLSLLKLLTCLYRWARWDLAARRVIDVLLVRLQAVEYLGSCCSSCDRCSAGSTAGSGVFARLAARNAVARACSIAVVSVELLGRASLPTVLFSEKGRWPSCSEGCLVKSMAGKALLAVVGRSSFGGMAGAASDCRLAV